VPVPPVRRSTIPWRACPSSWVELAGQLEIVAQSELHVSRPVDGAETCAKRSILDAGVWPCEHVPVEGVKEFRL
jgi:hypothetical protein